MDSRHRGAARTAGTGRGDVYFCMQPAEPSQRGPPRLHRVGKCSLFRFTDFIRQFRAGCTHHCVGGEPIRTVPPLRVVIDIAGQTPRSAPRRCRLTVSLARASAYVWTYHPFPRRRGATVVLACQAGARRARRSSGVGAREGEASRSCAGAGGAWLRCEARPCGHARVSSARRSAAGSRTKYRPAPTVSARGDRDSAKTPDDAGDGARCPTGGKLAALPCGTVGGLRQRCVAWGGCWDVLATAWPLILRGWRPSTRLRM